jgi:glycosyltransferase involved in cell wall biosynthesis
MCDGKGVSVVIPAYNEEKGISKVIQAAKNSEFVNEVIVVDDGSDDDTTRVALTSGAKVFRSDSNKGKGNAMNIGLLKSQGDVIAFLDGDLTDITSEKVNTLVAPALNGYDFAKASFDRSSGRITELTAKPLLGIFFPEIDFQQPLSGQIAIKRELARKLNFESGFNVDIALLIDAIMAGHKVKEVHLGKLDHEKKDLNELKEMARTIAQTIISHASKYGRFDDL